MTTRLIVIAGFCCAFAAGLTVGWLRPDAAPPALADRVAPAAGEQREGKSGDRGSWMAEQLGLSPDQQAQMKEIWSDVARRGSGRQQGEQRRKLRDERDAAIAQLVRPEDRPAYDAVLKQYEERIGVLESEWRQSYERAVERTKALLTREQREKYEALLAKQGWDGRGDRDRHRGGDRGGPSSRPTTAAAPSTPTTAPAGRQ